MSARSLLGLLQEQPTTQRVAALKRIIPLSAVQRVLADSGRADRHCPVLPLWLVVWLVIGIGLFARDSYRFIFKHLQPFLPGRTPGSNTIAAARLALGLLPLRLLSKAVVKLLCQPDTPGAFYQGMRLMALDGFVLDLPDTPENERAFGRPKSGRSPGAFPQVRVVALSEVGSHVFWRWTVKPFRRGESTMAPYLLGQLERGMLVLLDRNLISFRIVSQVLARKAHLLARVASNRILLPTKELADGSCLAKMYRTEYDRKKGRNGVVVRVIEYTLNDPQRPSKEKIHRLVTTLLDAEAYPALDLVELYHQRWEEELSIDELKTHQKERPTLRSKTPLGVVQEIEGLMLAHYCVRAVMYEAARERGLDPRRLSFTGTLKILRMRLQEAPKGRRALERWWEELLMEVGEEELPARRERINPRVIKKQVSVWPRKRAHHNNPPRPSMPFRDSILIT
jgi:transposase IS4-like protein/DDE family transposase